MQRYISHQESSYLLSIQTSIAPTCSINVKSVTLSNYTRFYYHC